MEPELCPCVSPQICLPTRHPREPSYRKLAISLRLACDDLVFAAVKVWLLAAVMFNCLQHILQVLLLPGHWDEVGRELDATLGTVINHIHCTYIDLTFFERIIGRPFLHIERHTFWINVQLVYPKPAILIGEISQAGGWQEGGECWLAKASAKALLRDVHGEIIGLVLQDRTGKCTLVLIGHLAAEESQG
ncbi:hypothetical protein CesoFtcFv8_006849 [Champsocephalus esox]|uniref:Uncharacterized protein n=1 Tax=Champsocephalus esox TaxID=159716 RepID=A0AAN8H7Y7_9TELE|nr:hypothetical protein CesoFtcFv8_006849 [Champsocephalus esox]